jgi:phospho-N-acetylmuramoyl-pentapeptide-transferase
MALYLGLLLFSFLITSIAIVPFIDLLFALRLVYKRKIFESDPPGKIGTPIGGGLLVIFLVIFLFAVFFPILTRLGLYITSIYSIKEELNIIFFTFISFALVGLYDDLVKIFSLPQLKFLGLDISIKSGLQIILSLLVGLILYTNLKIDFIHIPLIGLLPLGLLFIPVAAAIIMFFTRGLDISDGLDGLACGILLICLLGFWAISFQNLDTTLSILLALWIGSLVAFLYFNVYPARIWLGNAGSLAFGSTLAVIGLLLGKTGALLIIGGIFLLEALINSLQIIWLKIFHKRLFTITPLHYLILKRWPESKVVMRFWILSALLCVFGLWISQF